jgi:hypothetical protein
MSRSVELRDAQYERLEEAAAAAGVTPAEWISGRLLACPPAKHCSNGKPALTLAERFAGRVGVVGSGGNERLAERHSEVFGEMLEAQRKAGRL